MNEKDAARALQWIADVLDRVGARYQVVGGLAARAYGATRPLVDLDLYVEGEHFDSALDEVSAFCTWGPAAHRDDTWDLTFAKLDRTGVRIELARAEGARYFDRIRGAWVEQGIDFSRSERREVLGVLVPVIPREQLVAYKRALAREVDRVDLEQMQMR